MKHISFLMGAAFILMVAGVKAQPVAANTAPPPAPNSPQLLTDLFPTNTTSISTNRIVIVGLQGINNTIFVGGKWYALAELNWKADTNCSTFFSNPTQRPPELPGQIHTKLCTVWSNLYATFPWTNGLNQPSGHALVIETKEVKKTLRSFILETKEKYLEESSPTP